MAGSDDQAASDNTGVAQGFNMRLLVELEQRRYRGLILFGPPGTGKSLYAQSLGNTYGIPTILLNLKAMLQKELGESEQNLEGRPPGDLFPGRSAGGLIYCCGQLTGEHFP